jgi:hypothetical protein
VKRESSLVKRKPEGFTSLTLHERRATLHGKGVPGGLTGGATPVPIPNTEVKPSKADDTAAVRQWESRTLPGYNKGPLIERSAGLFLSDWDTGVPRYEVALSLGTPAFIKDGPVGLSLHRPSNLHGSVGRAWYSFRCKLHLNRTALICRQQKPYY